MKVEHALELSGIDPDTAYETFKACYPFHPSVLSVFERKWQSLPRFQRTRGILRLLALWIAHAYQEEHRKVAPAIFFESNGDMSQSKANKGRLKPMMHDPG